MLQIRSNLRYDPISQIDRSRRGEGPEWNQRVHDRGTHLLEIEQFVPLFGAGALPNLDFGRWLLKRDGLHHSL